ncbi:2-oxo acid dehydrogenase subunit E2 [Nonomuraea sp. NPDC005983]|uniref:2-oxo acid dehydrogenase subunit E2 n=1 Tax=Nonomuraea sp. NPDC005983 TaxID=3155595 RepID=UPI0033B1F3A0
MADEIRVPKLNNNDAAYTLIEWLAADGARVRRDDVVASLETSKAVEELVSEHDGVLTHLLPVGAECVPGELIARVGPRPEPRNALAPDPPAAADSLALDAPAAADSRAPGAPAAHGHARGREGGPLITAPAQALIDELGVDPARVRALGVKVVRRADVLRLAQPAPNSPASSPVGPAAGERAHPLGSVQRAVGRTVTLSHQTIPAGYTAIKVDVGPAMATARDLTRRVRKLVGLPDLLIAAVAGLHESFPLFFARLVDDRTAAVPDSPHVGVTIDLGTGLYVPVIRDARDRSVPEIAGQLAEFRKLAQHGGFREEQLAGGNIVVTLHHDADIVMAVPIVFPGQACAVALTSPQPDGERTVAVVGVAYDHRLINGRDAVLFLQALKESLESPSELP